MGDKSRFEMLLGVKEHEMHHRAQLFLIERMIGIVPHLTRARQERMAQQRRATSIVEDRLTGSVRRSFAGVACVVGQGAHLRKLHVHPGLPGAHALQSALHARSLQGLLGVAIR